MQVLSGVLRGAQVVDMADSRQVQPPGCLGGGYQQAALVVPEGVQRLHKKQVEYTVCMDQRAKQQSVER